MLEAAGLIFEVAPADIDEREIRDSIEGDGRTADAADVAAVLADAKAVSVSRANPQALVVGSDQVLSLNGRRYSKAKSIAEARAILDQLRGRTHVLISAVSLAHRGDIVWRASDKAELQMRSVSNAFLDHYLANMGDRALTAVGCYELEGLGAQLFDRIEGDYFTILGMPLLPLLAELRRRDVITS